MNDRIPASRWDLPKPFVLSFDVQPEDIDGYGHVNNTVYLRWINDLAWADSASVGMSAEYCKSIERGFAVHRHEIDYLGSAYLGDRVHAATWIVELDGKLRSRRRFQIVREADGKTLVRAQTVFICTNLSNGRPVRMPDVFKDAYRVRPEVLAALEASESRGLKPTR